MNETIALDRASVRQIDADGHLHVSRTPISKANVCSYWGREIPNWQDLGLLPDKTYALYRDAVELEKAASSFNGKPLLFGHRAVSADDHDHERTVGSVTNPEWDAPHLYAALDIWAGPAIKEIQSGRHEQLSSAYRYRAVMEPGTAPDGAKYDGRIVDIDANHVALVPEGRAGPDVVVLDAALINPRTLLGVLMPNKAVLSRSAATAFGALTMYASPRLAKDAKIDIASMLKGVDAKNMKAKAPAIAKAFDAALRPKLAIDADLDPAEVQEVVEQVAEVVAANAEEIADVVTDPVADPTVDESDDEALRRLLKAKGFSDDEVEAIIAKSMVPAADAEKTAAEKATQAADAAVKAATKNMVTPAAMDAAIAAAVKVALDSAKEVQTKLREAEAHIVPVTGKLAGAFDSAEGLYRAGLKALGVAEADALPEPALKPVFDAHAAVKQAPAAQHSKTLATDASITGKSIGEMFPDLKRLHG